MTRALLGARLRSVRNRMLAARWSLLEAPLATGALLAAAAYQGHALAADLLARVGGVEAAWPVLREWIYLGVALQALVVGYGAMEALLRPADGPLLLTLPIGPGPRYAVAALETALRYLPAPLLLAAFAAPLGPLGAPVALARSLALVGVGYLLAIATGIGVAAVAGRAAASPHGRGMKELLAGGWVTPDRAPFLYAPALGGGLAAVLAVPVQVSLDDWPADPIAALVGTAVIAAAAAALLAAGGVAYARGFARLAPLLESLDARYPLSPQAGSEGAVYGSGLIAGLAGHAGAVARRDLLSVRRRHRGEPVLLFVLGAATGLVLARTDASARAWDVAAVALVLFGARSGVRLGEADVEVAWLSRALPISWRALIAAKACVTLFHALHAALPFAFTALLTGPAPAAAWAVVTAVLASLLGPSLALAVSGRPGLARALYLPVAAGSCLAALALPVLAPALLAVLAAGAAVATRRTLGRGAA